MPINRSTPRRPDQHGSVVETDTADRCDLALDWAPPPA